MYQSAAARRAVAADTIVMSYNIKLRKMLPDIKTNITISGGDYFINGKNKRRIFTVKHNGNLTINDLTMRNGNADNGGAIRINDGRVTINNSTVRHNNGKRKRWSDLDSGRFLDHSEQHRQE